MRFRMHDKAPEQICELYLEEVGSGAVHVVIANRAYNRKRTLMRFDGHGYCCFSDLPTDWDLPLNEQGALQQFQPGEGKPENE